MSSDPQKVSRALAAWLRTAGAAERRTVVVRVRSSADLEALACALTRHHGHVESPGRGVVTAVVSAAGLAELARIGDVIAIDRPRELVPFTDIEEHCDGTEENDS